MVCAGTWRLEHLLGKVYFMPRWIVSQGLFVNSKPEFVIKIFSDALEHICRICYLNSFQTFVCRHCLRMSFLSNSLLFKHFTVLRRCGGLRLLVDQQDQFDRSLPTFIQLLDLSDSERDDYWKVMGMVEQGEEVDLFVDDPTDNERNALGSGSSTTTRLNNKVSSLYLFKLPNEVLLSLPTSERRAILDPNYYPSPEQIHTLQISMHCRSMALLSK